MSHPLRLVGHPLVDVGAATVAAYLDKRMVEEVTSEDLEQVAAYLEAQYQRKYLTGYLVCVFPNSAYVNPTAGAEKKQAFLDSHLYSFREPPQTDAERCGICMRPAASRGFRQHVPMLTGEGALNFFPNARPGLPLCPGCMISIAALPLGALRCAGRALLVHADDPALTYYFARTHLERNRRLLHLQDLADDAKFPDAKQTKTRLVEELTSWAAEESRQQSRAARGKRPPSSVSAYHLTNSGQGPDLDIYHLPAPLLGFLVDAEAEPYRAAWHRITGSAWRLNEKGDDTATYRNYLYEDLFALPQEWKRFVCTYFLRRAYRLAGKDDPRGGYDTKQELDLVNWPLTALFLEEIVGMEKQRVDAIRNFGDRLATYIAERNPGFWNDFNLAKSYRGLRARLIRANREEEKADRPLLIGFDDFITIFEFGEETPRADWNLARDLVLIRVIEQLHQRRFFQQHREALDISTAAEEDSGEELLPASVA